MTDNNCSTYGQATVAGDGTPPCPHKKWTFRKVRDDLLDASNCLRAIGEQELGSMLSEIASKMFYHRFGELGTATSHTIKVKLTDVDASGIAAAIAGELKARDRIATNLFSDGGSMTWNYRVMRHVDKSTGEQYFAMHEVICELADTHDGWSENPVPVIAETVKDLRRTLEWMIFALNKVVLDYETGQPSNKSETASTEAP